MALLHRHHSQLEASIVVTNLAIWTDPTLAVLGERLV
jgi:hypothetical protein